MIRILNHFPQFVCYCDDINSVLLIQNLLYSINYDRKLLICIIVFFLIYKCYSILKKEKYISHIIILLLRKFKITNKLLFWKL